MNAPHSRPHEGHAYPLLERTPAAIALAFVGGLLNAWTFEHAQTFATVQSGNVIAIGYQLLAGDPPKLLGALLSVIAFAAGACACSVFILITARLRQPYSFTILTIEFLTLVPLSIYAAMPGVPPIAVAWAISFVAGVQGSAFHRETGMIYGNVAVTFVLQMGGVLLGRAVGHRIATDGQPHLRQAGAYFVVLLAFAGGGAAGFGVDQIWAGAAILASAVVIYALACVAAFGGHRADPAQNAPVVRRAPRSTSA